MAVVGKLRVLLSADSAQITSDLGKARAAVKQTGTEIRQMGSAGAAFRTVTAEVKGVGPAIRGVEQATQLATQSLTLMGAQASPAVASITTALSGLVSGGFTPVGIAIAAVGAAFALLAAQKEEIVSVFAATEDRVKSTRESLEKLRIELDLLRRGKPAESADVDIEGAERELRRRKNIAALERQAGFIGHEDVGSFWRNLGSVVFPREGFLPSIDNAAQAADALVREQERYIASLREQQGVQEEIEQRRKRTADAAKEEAEAQKKIAAEAKAAESARVQFEAAELARERARRDKGVAIQSLLHPDLLDPELERQRSRIHDAMEDLRRAADAPVEKRNELRARILHEREMLDLLTKEKDARQQIAAVQAAATRAEALRRENDRTALRLDPSLTDRGRALAEHRAEVEETLASKAMEGLERDSPEYLALVEEFRRQEAAINREHDQLAIDAQSSFLDRVDQIRRQAQAATLADDRSLTRIKIDEAAARHSAEVRLVGDAERRGLLTEEQAGQKRRALYAAHIDQRRAILREGREQELAWLADYNQRVLALAAEGETDQSRLARIATEARLAELREETRKQVEELRRRGDLTRAAEVESLSRQAQERIRRQGELQAAVTGEDLGDGFRGRISLLREETAGWGRLGAQMAEVATNDLAGGVADALAEIARGSKSASEAFRDFAARFAQDVARMIQQALIMKAILALFPGLSSGGAGAGAGAGAGGGAGAASGAASASAAHGGTFKVGGFGGLDSQLVTMRVSPGEVIRVTDGANSRGEGDVHVALTVRPPAVIADEVMARSSPDARAAIVGSALRRPGRRGMRARD